MPDSTDPYITSANMFASWMKSVNDFWSKAPGPFETHEKQADSGDDTDQNTSETDFLQTGMDTWRTIASAAEQYLSGDSLFAGAGNFQDTLLKMIQPVFSGITGMLHEWQAQSLNSAHDMSFPEFKIPGFDTIDSDMLNVWNKLYDNELRKYLKAPQLGLAREHQEKIARFLDRFNILQSALAEFLSTLAGPLKKSQTAFQKKLTELAKNNKTPADARQYYQIWLKILEGQYMTLFQSPEYIRTLGNTLSASAQYNRAKKELINDVLGQLSIPSSEHLDAVFKELHVLKKRLRSLEKAVTSN